LTNSFPGLRSSQAFNFPDKKTTIPQLQSGEGVYSSGVHAPTNGWNATELGQMCALGAQGNERGAVHAYVTRSAGSERLQMARDLSVNGKEEERLALITDIRIPSVAVPRPRVVDAGDAKDSRLM